MKWIDTADDAVATLRARGDADPQVITRDQWLAMSPQEQQQAQRTMAVQGVRFRGEADRKWVIVSLADMRRGDRWTIWDMRGTPTVVVAGIRDLALALSLGSLVGTSTMVRVMLSGATVLAATGVALADVWRRR